MTKKQKREREKERRSANKYVSGKRKKEKARRENSDLNFCMRVLIVGKAGLPYPFLFFLYSMGFYNDPSTFRTENNSQWQWKCSGVCILSLDKGG